MPFGRGLFPAAHTGGAPIAPYIPNNPSSPPAPTLHTQSAANQRPTADPFHVFPATNSYSQGP
jgi:hypothetical protein